MMVVREAMTAPARVVGPDQTIREAARLMADLDAGAIPVAEEGRLVGMLTDRDIAVRAVAEGAGPDTPVRAVMSSGVETCTAEAECAAVALRMGALRVRRLPVLDGEGRLVGVVSLGDLSTRYSSGSAGGALGHISGREPDHAEER